MSNSNESSVLPIGQEQTTTSLPQSASFSGDQWGQAGAGTEHASKASRGAGVIFSEIPCSHAGLLTPGLPSSKKSENTLRSFSTLAMNFTPQCRWEMSFTNGQAESQFVTPRQQAQA